MIGTRRGPIETRRRGRLARASARTSNAWSGRNAVAKVHPIPGYSNVTVERDVPARMRDGVMLYADVYRPATPGRYPVILFRHRYDTAPAASLASSQAPWSAL